MRLLLRGIGTRFVERFDVEASVEAAHELDRRAAQGESLAFFAEGTFRRESGLREFHMGAFVAAASAGIPVVPVALRGTRSVLRDGQWLPRRALVQIIVLPPRPARRHGLGRGGAAARAHARRDPRRLRRAGPRRSGSLASVVLPAHRAAAALGGRH